LLKVDLYLKVAKPFKPNPPESKEIVWQHWRGVKLCQIRPFHLILSQDKTPFQNKKGHLNEKNLSVILSA
jgi:hypothetical protein